MTRVTREKGSIFVLVTAGIVAFLGAVALSVDVGYLYVVRNQLQNAADAAALAGAQGLMAQPGNYTEEGAAVRWAKQYAAANRADGTPVVLATSEISFPRPDVILIDIRRPVRTFFSTLVGLRSVPVRVVAAATAAPVTGGSGGWRPFSGPDQFAHGSTCVTPLDGDHGPFNPNLHTWNGITATDSYRSPHDPNLDNTDVSTFSDCSGSAPTGFIAPRDVDGRLVELKLGSQGSAGDGSPGNFYPVALGGTGATNYENNIRYGWDGTIRIGDILTTETGNMTGPTKQGVDYLISLDPGARLVTGPNGRKYVQSDRYPPNESPRIVPIALFDPTTPPGNGRTTFRVANIGAFFIASVSGSRVYGVFINRRLANAIRGNRPNSTSTSSAGAAGRLLGTVELLNPAEFLQ
jgi:hypothetical protein